MIAAGSRLRQIGWLVVLTICLTAVLALGFKVRAVVSEVRLAERRIVELEQDKIILETEFQARANQQQLSNWNAVDFGFSAPGAEQFVENERQLAQFGKPRGVGAPDPIRVARAQGSADDSEGGVFAAMVSPITGKRASGNPGNENNSDSAAGHGRAVGTSGVQLTFAERMTGAADMTGTEADNSAAELGE